MAGKNILLLAEQKSDLAENLQFLFSIKNRINIAIDAYRESDRVMKICRERQTPLFVNIYGNYLTIGRHIDYELSDVIQYRVEEFSANLNIKIYFKFFMIFNRIEKEELSLFAHITNNQYSTIDIESVEYILVYDGGFVRLYDSSYSLLCTIMQLRVENKMFRSKLPGRKKHTKNIKKDVFNNLVGTIYRPAEDLKRIKVRKYK